MSRLQNLNKIGNTISNAGIYENCKINIDYVTAKSATGNTYETFKVEITTKDGNSKTFNLMRPSKGFAGDITVDGVTRKETDKEALVRAEDRILQHIVKLVTLVDGNKIAAIEEESFKGMAKELVEIFKENNEKYNPSFNVKIVLDKDYKYTALPNYANGTYELYNESKLSKLAFTAKDRVVKPVATIAPSELDAPMPNDNTLPF